MAETIQKQCRYLNGWNRCEKSTFKRCEQVRKEGRCYMDKLERLIQDGTTGRKTRTDKGAAISDKARVL